MHHGQLIPLSASTFYEQFVSPFTTKVQVATSTRTMSLLSRLFWHVVALNLLVDVANCDESASFREQCLSFKPDTLICNSTLTRLEHVSNGTTIELDDNVSSCNRPSQEVTEDICRIALQIPTSYRSSISFELWLPRTWEGARYLATGNGGIDGCAYISGL